MAHQIRVLFVRKEKCRVYVLEMYAVHSIFLYTFLRKGDDISRTM